jgi:DNA-binding transcriptional LysR family regulator
MDNWDEIRTAYQVARHGTVSAAAEVLGVHHATVIRHIDALEGRLGVKLFQRHARGYTATEAGEDLMRVGQATDDQFGQLEGRIKGRGSDVSGELVITSLHSIAPLLSPVLVEFQDEYPDLLIRYLTDDRVFRLEYGEAHVAVRAGAAPQEPDNVVQPFGALQVGLYAAQSYIDKFGKPKSVDDFKGHRFVSGDSVKTRAPFQQWLLDIADRDTHMFRGSDPRALETAVIAGAGIGFLPRYIGEARDDVVEVMEPLPEWHGPMWLVTHVDLHRTVKVQTFLSFLKDRAKTWL